MKSPNNVAGVRRIIGMVNYLAKFLPNLAEMCELLRQLNKQNEQWCWSRDHERALTAIKEAITRTPVLRYFDDKLNVTLQCDASSMGL